MLNIVTFIRVSARYIPKIEIIDDTKAGVDVSVSSFFLHWFYFTIEIEYIGFKKFTNAYP
jgi:hypothetical protein